MNTDLRLGSWMTLILAVVSVGAAGRELPLIDAVKRADSTAVRELLRRNVAVNATDIDGTTALHWAADGDDVAMVELLLKAGANVRAANRYGVMPLSLAAANGHAAIMERLLTAGADPNGAMAGGETALMTAARSGKPDAVRMLLAHGADPNAREDRRGQTALMWAAVGGNVDVIPVLISAGADPNARSRPPLGAKPQKKRGDGGGDANLGMDVTYVDQLTPLLFAARRGQLGAVRALLEGGANIKETAQDGAGPVALAIANAHYDVALFLLEKGADATAATRGWTALHQLAKTRRPSTGHIPGPIGFMDPLGLKVAAALVAHGADVNARMTIDVDDGYRHRGNRQGATPFWLAAKGVDAEMMRLLVALGADPTLPSTIKETPLMVAAGVNIRSPGEDSGTDEEAFEAVKFCLEIGCGDVNAVNAEGWTALHAAAFRGANSVVQLLVDSGAKLEMRTDRGWTPWVIANGVHFDNFLYRQPHTAELLRKMMEAHGLQVEDRPGVYLVPPDDARKAPSRDK